MLISAFVWVMWDKSKNKFCYRLSNKRREQKATPSEISRNSQKFEKQFSFISSYLSELNTSVPASLE